MTKRLRRDAFPSLMAFLRGYLHEDFPEVHGSLRGAVTAFSKDASPDERRRLADELAALLRVVSDRPERDLKRFVTSELGTAGNRERATTSRSCSSSFARPSDSPRHRCRSAAFPLRVRVTRRKPERP